MKKTLRLICPTCRGRQVAWRGNVLDECYDCGGRGWLAVPSLMAEGIVGLGLFVGFALLVALVPS